MATSYLDARAKLNIGTNIYTYNSLPRLGEITGKDISKVPFSHRILLENLLRYLDEKVVFARDIDALLNYDLSQNIDYEIQFTPSRVLLQDFTGVPVVADLAAMRAGAADENTDPERINPLCPVDLVIDHSIQVDFYGSSNAPAKNTEADFKRNGERYQFLKWGQKAFSNFRVVPPSTGICHQVNLEHLATCTSVRKLNGEEWIFPDTLVGTDSHTTMVNGLGVLGWGVGGIEAEAAMLNQPISLLIPPVVGFKMTGALAAGATATDLVLTVTRLLRQHGVVGKFVEFYGPGVSTLSVADRATLSNMAPEYGATCGLFRVDQTTIDYMKLTGRSDAAERTEAYYKAQGLWADSNTDEGIHFSETLELALGTVSSTIAGPSKPHESVPLAKSGQSFDRFLKTRYDSVTVGEQGQLRNGDIVIAAITSCTNTSNPTLMITAGLVAKKAADRGLKTKPWVKTSLAPGSKAVTQLLKTAGLLESLEALGFYLVGYGCTTCIGNSGPLNPEIADQIEKRDLATVSVLSGNRNFEARIHPQVMANYLMSPPLVVAFALSGSIATNLTQEPLGMDKAGRPVYLRDVWPTPLEIAELLQRSVKPETFASAYNDLFSGDEQWKRISTPESELYKWDHASTYIQKPPFLGADYKKGPPGELSGARILAMLGDFVTTDHISPAGNIGSQTPAGQYLLALGVHLDEFNSYGSRRGNHEVMVRGTFANTRLKNKMVSKEGGFTKVYPSGEETTIFAASEKYKATSTPLVIFAGKEYGTGSSRDWAAKGTRLLSVRAVVAESFERIHRSNLVGMGVLPLQIPSTPALELVGDELITINGIDQLSPKGKIEIQITRNGQTKKVSALVRIDTATGLRYYKDGGILPFVLKRLYQPTK